MIKLIALDLDGTLLNDQGFISDKTCETIQEVRELGIKIVICTGRPFYSLSPLLKQLKLDMDDYVISFNGALLSNVKGDKTFFEQKIGYDNFLKLKKLSEQLNVNYHVQSTQGIYTNDDRISPYTAYDSYLNEATIYPISEKEFKQIPIFKMMFVGPENKIENLEAKIPKEFKSSFNAMQSLEYFYEFLHIEASKGLTLEKLVKNLRINPSEVLAIGDNENDLSMFDFAGISVAMGNASEQVKKDVDYITKTNVEEGVRHSLLQLIKNRSKA